MGNNVLQGRMEADETELEVYIYVKFFNQLRRQRLVKNEPSLAQLARRRSQSSDFVSASF